MGKVKFTLCSTFLNGPNVKLASRLNLALTKENAAVHKINKAHSDINSTHFAIAGLLPPLPLPVFFMYVPSGLSSI